MTYVVTDDHGRPVAVAPTEKRAKAFANRNASAIRFSKTVTRWTDTGKLMAGTRWTGWEVREVRTA